MSTTASVNLANEMVNGIGQPLKKQRKLKDEAVRNMPNKERIAYYRSQWTEEEKQAYNIQAKEYQKKRRALANLGTVVASKKTTVADFIDQLDDKTKTTILATFSKNGNRSNELRAVNKPVQSPVEYCQDAGCCRRCKDTCGQNGCSASCKCLYGNYECCKHSNPSYKCPANLEKRIRDLNFHVCDETFLVGKYRSYYTTLSYYITSYTTYY